MGRIFRGRWLSGPLNVILVFGVMAAATGVGAALDMHPLEGPLEQRTELGHAPVQTMAATVGIWLSTSEVRSLPTTGAAWSQVKATADGSLGTPSIRDQESKHDTNTLAVALVAVRTGTAKYYTKATDAIMRAIGTEDGGQSLALGRNLVSYVIAADLVQLSGSNDQRFRSWLRGVIGKRMSDGKSLRETHQLRPNNWGTHAGASRAAAAVYLGDSAELSATAQVFKGWLGDRASWSSFRWRDTSWQCDPAQPVGINLPGCMKSGHSIDGVLPDDQRQGGTFTWPPPKENYVYGALQGAVVQAEILYRAGYPTWDWQSRALLRAFQWLHVQANYPASGDDQWQPWLVNRRYGTDFPATAPARSGKNMGWTDWTHGS